LKPSVTGIFDSCAWSDAAPSTMSPRKTTLRMILFPPYFFCLLKSRILDLEFILVIPPEEIAAPEFRYITDGAKASGVSSMRTI
jgi:hypothetical protein